MQGLCQKFPRFGYDFIDKCDSAFVPKDEIREGMEKHGPKWLKRYHVIHMDKDNILFLWSGSMYRYYRRCVRSRSFAVYDNMNTIVVVFRSCMP